MLNKYTAIIIKWLEVKATDEDKIELMNWLQAHPAKGKVDEEVIRLIKSNQKLNAVKYITDAYMGMGLKEAKDYMDNLEANIAYDINPTSTPLSSQGNIVLKGHT